MQPPSFRVIIIGAGPSGLYMARALDAANIDFIILEQGPPTFRERGNHMIIWPHTVRLLHQLGLFEEAKSRSYKLSSKVDMMSNGHIIGDYPVWDILESSHGYPVLPLQRCDLLEILYQGLSSRDNLIRTRAKVVKIETIDHGVQVYLADGTVEAGSVVIGADGAHSVARSFIEEAVPRLNMDPPNASRAGIPNSSHFCTIYGEGPNNQKIRPGIFFETRDKGRGIQLGANSDSVRIVLYKKLPQPATDRVDYTQQQMEEAAESFFDMFATPGVKFGAIWPGIDKGSARMVNQEEGFAEPWHTDRVVLTGDAAAKFTSVNALGVNCALNSTALLASELQKVVSSHGNPDGALLEAAFARYQRYRGKQMSDVYDYGYSSVRQLTWDSWTYWFLDRFASRWVHPETIMKRSVHPMVCNGQILSYLPFSEIESVMPWKRYADGSIDPKL